MLPEERAREKIDKQLINASWDIVSRNEYVPKSTSAVKEALIQGNTESDYLLFVDDKAIAVVEAKREENPLGLEVEKQAEDYARGPQNWYGLWYQGLIPLVYMANGKKIYFKNMLIDPDGDYVELLKSKVSPARKKEIKKQLVFFGEVDTLDVHTINWSMRFNRNNQSYRMLVSVCHLVIKGLLQTKSDGSTKLMDFLDDQQMHHLYEKFILE